MGQLGFMEMLVIFIVALLVFGPKKLPELGKSLGKGLREFKKATNELKSSWDEQVRDIESPITDVKKEITNVGQDLKTDLYNSMEPEPPAAPPNEQVEQKDPQTSSTQPTESTVPKEHV